MVRRERRSCAYSSCGFIALNSNAAAPAPSYAIEGFRACAGRGARATPVGTSVDALLEAEDQADAQHVEVGFDQAGTSLRVP